MSSSNGKPISRRAVFATSGGAVVVASTPAVAEPVAATVDTDIRPAGAGSVPRPIASIINDWSNSVMSYGAVGDDVTDDTEAFRLASAAHLGKQVFVPPGHTYRLGEVGGLGAAGSGVVGVAGYSTILKPLKGLRGAIFFNPNSGRSASAYGLLRDLRFDLEGEHCTAIDLSHCDTFVVERVNGRGGNRRSQATGTLVKFGAPTNSSSYNNVIRDCGAEYFARAVIFGGHANQNRIDGGTFTNNNVAIDCAPDGGVARPQVLGARIEGNNIGIREGATAGVYLAYFENNAAGDFEFTRASARCVILPGTTSAVTATPLRNRDRAADLRCLSYSLGYYDSADSTSNPAFEMRRQIRSLPGQTIDPNYPDLNFTDLHMGTLLMGNGHPVEGVDQAGTSSVVVALVNASDEVEISGYHRATGQYRPVNIGGGAAVQPTTDKTTNLGSRRRQWKDVVLDGRVVIRGTHVVGAQGAAIADATDQTSAVTQLNSLLAALRAHGLIAT